MDRWKEIYHTLRKNPMRTFLTAFGVAWGIFMLLVVLGLGQGLENGVRNMFKGFATNSVFVWGQSTSISYKGMPERRYIQLTSDDIEIIRRNVPGIKVLCPRIQLGGYMGGNNVYYNNLTGAFSINGDIPDINHVYMWQFPKGRFINHSDIEQNRKVCVIGKRVEEILFEGKNPIGEYVRINNVYFQVVGTFKPIVSGRMTERDEQTIIIPFTTFQKAFNAHNDVHWFSIVGEDNVKGSVLETQIKTALAAAHQVHPNDPRAFGSFSSEDRFRKVQMTFLTVRWVAWFVGIMTLFAGVIGVTNIMLITVKERTKEIGIRRAIGARPWSIIIQIMLESIVLTTLAGYLGMLAGIWLVESVSKAGISGDMFKDPEIKIPVALISLVILIVSGALAGILPAARAIQIKPVEALRDE